MDVYPLFNNTYETNKRYLLEKKLETLRDKYAYQW